MLDRFQFSRRFLLAQFIGLALGGCGAKNMIDKDNEKVERKDKGDLKILTDKLLPLKAVEILPTPGIKPVGLIVGLHGWGGNSLEISSLAPFLNLPDYQMLFPEGPIDHPGVPGGKMWYDLDRSDWQGLPESRQLLKDFLNKLPEITGIPTDKTILLGFSQGGAMTLDVGLSLSLAGLISLSGYLHPIDRTPNQELNHAIPPILIVHGRQDQVVPLKMALDAKSKLTELGAKVAYAEYDMGHEVPPVAIARVREFITLKR